MPDHGYAWGILYKQRRRPALLPDKVLLAHNGVLFLDEWSELRRHIFDVLRQPLENDFTKKRCPVLN
jgi:Magnesium chelatase, subunit ChlI